MAVLYSPCLVNGEVQPLPVDLRRCPRSLIPGVCVASVHTVSKGTLEGYILNPYMDSRQLDILIRNSP